MIYIGSKVKVISNAEIYGHEVGTIGIVVEKKYNALGVKAIDGMYKGIVLYHFVSELEKVNLCNTHRLKEDLLTGLIRKQFENPIKKTKALVSKIKANDKTLKTARVGNWYHQVKSKSQADIEYTRLITLHDVNRLRA